MRQKTPGRNLKNILLNSLLDLIELDKVVENLKIDAAVKEDFNLIDAFSLLDVNGRGYITPTDLRQALSELGIKCNIDEVELIFERFATSKGKEASILKYSDF